MMGYHDGQLCPVCGQFQFGEDDNFEICEICGWEDDSLQRDDPDYAGGANHMSLNQARKAWEEEKKKRCPVCFRYTFERENNYEICQICGWEDDSLQRDEPDFAGGANKMSLNQARQAWKEKQRIKCPVCGQYEFERDNSLEICEVCGWQNDGDQLYDPNEERGANQMSLNQARKAWAQGKPVK